MDLCLSIGMANNVYGIPVWSNAIGNGTSVVTLIIAMCLTRLYFNNVSKVLMLIAVMLNENLKPVAFRHMCEGEVHVIRHVGRDDCIVSFKFEHAC